MPCTRVRMQKPFKRKSRSRARGVTLIEILIVVAIITLITGGVAVAAFGQWEDARRSTAATDAKAIREAVRTWWLTNDSAACPSFDDLVESGTVDDDGRRRDPWGGPWRIQCTEGNVSVTSAGPDRQPDTDDDIRAPTRPPS